MREWASMGPTGGPTTPGNPRPKSQLLAPGHPSARSRGGAGLPRDPVTMAPAVTIRPRPFSRQLPHTEPWEGPPRPSGAPDTHGGAPASGSSVSEGRSRTRKVKAPRSETGVGVGGWNRECKGPPLLPREDEGIGVGCGGCRFHPQWDESSQVSDATELGAVGLAAVLSRSYRF